MLNDAELIEEAQQVCEDLKGWLAQKFSVSADQQEYLDGVPDRVLFIWGAQLAGLLAARAQFEFIGSPRSFRTKQTDIKCEGRVRHIPDDSPFMDMAATVEFIQP